MISVLPKLVVATTEFSIDLILSCKNVFVIILLGHKHISLLHELLPQAAKERVEKGVRLLAGTHESNRSDGQSTNPTSNYTQKNGLAVRERTMDVQ